VFLFISVYKASGLIQLLNAVTVETVKSWNISVIYYIVWFLLRSQKCHIKPVYEVVGCL